jgi:hypothetical protein
MLDTRSEHRLGCERPAYLSRPLHSAVNEQLTAEASILSFVCVTVVLILITVLSTLSRDCLALTRLFAEECTAL